MQEIFDRYVETSFDDGLAQAPAKLRQFELNYRSLLSADKNLPVLDIGIGRGEMLACLRDWGYAKVHGVDISPSAVRHCRSMNLPCEQVDDTVAWLDAHPGEFGAITCLDVLEHIPRDDVIRFLCAVRQALREDGIAIFQVPNLQAPFGYLHHFNDFTHRVGYVEHSLRQVLLAAHFAHHEFHGFEEIWERGWKAVLVKCGRWLLRKLVRIARKLNRAPNPSILDPVFFAVAHK